MFFLKNSFLFAFSVNLQALKNALKVKPSLLKCPVTPVININTMYSAAMRLIEVKINNKQYFLGIVISRFYCIKHYVYWDNC